MRKFREVERGWTDNAGEVQVQKTAVDNVGSNWDAILLSNDLESSDDTQLNTERNLDFWVERLVVHYTPYAICTALNTAGYVEASFGLAIFQDNVAARFDVPTPFSTNAMWSTNVRGAPEYVRMLSCRFHRCINRGIPTGGEPEVADYDPSHAFQMFDVKNIFLKKGEGIVFWISQTQLNDDFFTWSTSDIAGACWMAQALVRKKRGR